MRVYYLHLLPNGKPYISYQPSPVSVRAGSYIEARRLLNI